MPPTQLHHPNRPHQENATTLTHDYAKLQAKAKHDATQIQHIVTWSDSTWDYLRLFHIPMMWVRLPAFPEGCHRKARLRQAEAAVAHCAVLPPAVQAGGIWRSCYLMLSVATAPITRRNCNWKLILTRRTSQEWEILGKWLAYSIHGIQHMSYGSIWLILDLICQ